MMLFCVNTLTVVKQIPCLTPKNALCAIEHNKHVKETLDEINKFSLQINLKKVVCKTMAIML